MGTKFQTFRNWMNTRIPLPRVAVRPTTRVQRQSLLRMIALATETDIPLPELMDAWSKDETGRYSLRLRRLSRLLNQGTPLPNAVEEIRGVLDEGDVLAIRFGTQSGTLSASVREAIGDDSYAAVRGPHRASSLAFYLCSLAVVATAIVLFLQIKIVPAMQSIFREYDLATPRTLNWSVGLSNFVSEFWWLFLLLGVVVGLVAFSTGFGRRWRRALVSRLFWPLRELRVADLLQKLSVTSRAGRPLMGAISTLARYHFDPALRHKLLVIHNEMEHGAEIWQSMGSTGLLTNPEVELLETADRVGNRGWVLNQLAAVKSRTNQRRLALWTELAMPIAIILAGAFVLFQALSVFDSLLNLVYSLV